MHRTHIASKENWTLFDVLLIEDLFKITCEIDTRKVCLSSFLSSTSWKKYEHCIKDYGSENIVGQRGSVYFRTGPLRPIIQT